jgi:hypothetical protein
VSCRCSLQLKQGRSRKGARKRLCSSNCLVVRTSLSGNCLCPPNEYAHLASEQATKWERHDRTPSSRATCRPTTSCAPVTPSSIVCWDFATHRPDCAHELLDGSSNLVRLHYSPVTSADSHHLDRRRDAASKSQKEYTYAAHTTRLMQCTHMSIRRYVSESYIFGICPAIWRSRVSLILPCA